MDTHETDASAWSRPHDEEDAAASREADGTLAGETEADEVIVIESHEIGYTDPDEAAESGSDLPADATAAPAGTIWSAGTSGPAEPAMPEEDLSEEDPGAADVAAAEPVMAASEPALASEPTLTGEPAVTSATDGDAQRWSEIKALFVDDPGESVKLASGLVERAMENLVASLRQRQESLSSWESGDAADTEGLRNVLRSYRSLFDQLEGMSGQFESERDRVA